MNEVIIAELLDLVYRKNQLDQRGNWSNGSSAYLREIRKELIEVEDELELELELDRQCYLEDELGDILWDYLNILQCLKTEQDISIDRVFSRAVTKYDERFSGKEAVRKRFIEVWIEPPDVRFDNGTYFVSGNRGCSEWTFIATRQDGTAIEVDGCDLFTFREGKIRVKNSLLKNRT